MADLEISNYNMIGTIKVNLNDYDSKVEFMEMLRIREYITLIFDIEQKCRHIYKYTENVSEDLNKFIEEIEEMIRTANLPEDI